MGALKRAIGLRGAVAINVITMIGIGPLVTIPLVLATLGGPLALLGWIGGAIVALCDGLVWSELASRFPGSGGTYVYLRESFGPNRAGRALAFLFNWQFLLYAPCLLASGYIGLTDYAGYLFPALAANPVAHGAVAASVGIATILLLFRRTSGVTALASGLAIAAGVTIALVALAGLTHANFAQAFHLDATVRLGSGLLAGFGSALYVTIYDYTGYADAALLGDEVIHPTRTIPRSILLSVLIVAVLYIALQVGVLGVVPWRSLLDASGAPTAASQYVGSLVVERTWGHVAALGVTTLVLVTAFASLYGNLLGFSRIPFAAARDGAFLRVFAKLHPRKEIPHVALFAVGGLSLIAAFFSLAQVIAFLTAGIALIQGIAQIVALGALRARAERAPFRMPLYPLPAIVALLGWSLAFIYTGGAAIALGIAWLLVGAIVYLVTAKVERWWPLAAGLVLLLVPLHARAATAPTPGWAAWNASAVERDRGYPVFTVDGQPFFVDGAAFFYERIPHAQWLPALEAYRRMGINTLDLYLMWNWHVTGPAATPEAMRFDFTGATDPRRDLRGLLRLTHALGFKLILRPGPVIRNEWRNGGYPAWLLERPAYRMPLHDVLTGRYPATATLQNAHADAAAAEWLHNATHLAYASAWLRAALSAAAPDAQDVIAIALDDDQGAYIDNDTWPAPNWHAYVGWLRAAVQSTVGSRVPLFINTYDMKVPAATPAWAWGDWYQSDAYRIGTHDLAQLDFATGLLQTQPSAPTMMAEFQAGWLQGADEAAPRPSDPSNTALALNQLLRDGVHGIVNFPVQDTMNPPGWEAPWANASYAWDAALTVDLREAPRYAPTAAFGDDVRRYGTLLARTHPVLDAAIVWPATLFPPGALTNADFASFETATIAMQTACRRHGLSCGMVDLTLADATTLRQDRVLLLPTLSKAQTALMLPAMRARLAAFERSGILQRDVARLAPQLRRAPDTTLLIADDGTYAFLDAINPSDLPHVVGPLRVHLASGTETVPAIPLAPRSGRLVPVHVPERIAFARVISTPVVSALTPLLHRHADLVLANARMRVAFAPNAGSRIELLAAAGVPGNAATSVGLLRDAIDPPLAPSARDYIAAYTHPMPAGTFNRPYTCTTTADSATCSYRAPDIPLGGATFTRTLRLARDATHLDVHETFSPNAATTSAQLASISGFAFAPGDTLLAPAGADFVAILHGRRLTWLRWRTADLARLHLRATRGAEIVRLVFARRDVRFQLGVAQVASPAEALRQLGANPG